jgi:hypothetical protein
VIIERKDLPSSDAKEATTEQKDALEDAVRRVQISL